jgi:hypothetical protein
MVQRGTVRNGVIVPEGPPPPEGTEVVFEPAGADTDKDWGDIPPSTETREEILESLRQSIAETKAGVKGIPLDEAMAQIRAELNLPKVESE